MDVKPVFAVTLVACCMAFSFVLKVYTNQSNVMLFGNAESPKLVTNEPKVLTNYFKNIKAETRAPQLKGKGEELTTGAIMVRLYAE